MATSVASELADHRSVHPCPGGASCSQSIPFPMIIEDARPRIEVASLKSLAALAARRRSSKRFKSAGQPPDLLDGADNSGTAVISSGHAQKALLRTKGQAYGPPWALLRLR